MKHAEPRPITEDLPLDQRKRVIHSAAQAARKGWWARKRRAADAPRSMAEVLARFRAGTSGTPDRQAYHQGDFQ